jgi:hypothetical protein
MKKQFTSSSWLDQIELDKFKQSYENAILQKKDTFYYRGAHFLVPFAKYVIEYLETIKPKK